MLSGHSSSSFLLSPRPGRPRATPCPVPSHAFHAAGGAPLEAQSLERSAGRPLRRRAGHVAVVAVAAVRWSLGVMGFSGFVGLGLGGLGGCSGSAVLKATCTFNCFSQDDIICTVILGPLLFFN